MAIATPIAMLANMNAAITEKKDVIADTNVVITILTIIAITAITAITAAMLTMAIMVTAVAST